MTTPYIAMVLVACCVVTASSCGTSQGFQPIADPTRRIELPGLSVLPPQGGSWFVLPVSPQESFPPTSLVRFSKRLQGAPTAGLWGAHMVFGGVMVMLDLGERRFSTPTEFLDWFTGDRQIRPGEAATQRQRYVEFEATLDESLKATCVRYRRLTEVAAVQGFPGSVAMNSTYGLNCLHPYWPQYVVDLT